MNETNNDQKTVPGTDDKDLEPQDSHLLDKAWWESQGKATEEESRKRLLKAMDEDGKGPGPMVIPVHQFPNPTEVVLREWNTFLREQLAERNSWQAQALEREVTQANLQIEELNRLTAQNTKLRIALAQAVHEVTYHNSQDNNPWSTDEGLINNWASLVDGD